MNHTIITLHDLLVYESRKIWDTETRLEKVLPRWTEQANTYRLKEIVNRYHYFIQKHIKNIQGFFMYDEVDPQSTRNKTIMAFINETEEKLSACADPEVFDACMLAAIQELNHYKISMYGTAAAFAQTLELEVTTDTYHQAEMDEREIDESLSHLAQHEVNQRAKAPIIK
jgi:ferritin-like metal-binding protein YciE